MTVIPKGGEKREEETNKKQCPLAVRKMLRENSYFGGKISDLFSSK